MVRFGDQGPVVSALQFELQKLGYYAGPLDGEFREVADLAVRAVQMEFRLAADGLVGPKTRQILDSVRGHWNTGRDPNPRREVPPG